MSGAPALPPLTWRDRAVAALSDHVAQPLLRFPVPFRLFRAAFELAAPRRAPGAVEWAEMGGVRCRRMTPEGASGDILWCHGGAFVAGSPRAHARLTDPVAARAGMRVTTPAYRLAPEHPFPAGYEDCLAAARAMPRPFVLAGDSAGATLAAAVLARLCAEGRPPRRAVLIAPAGLLDPDRPDPEGADPMFLSRPLLARILRAYAPGADPRDPRLSPALADYPGAPPVLIHVAEGEMLEADAHAIADRVRAGGGTATVETARGMPHAWHLAAGVAPAADAALARVADFLSERAP